MWKRLRAGSWIAGAALAAGLAAVLMSGCPFSRGRMGSIDQVAVVKYRRATDEDGKVVRLVGAVRNCGPLRSPRGEIVVTLYGRTGSLKGQNRVALRSLAADEEEHFAVAVTSHGKVHEVKIEVVEPGTVVGETEGATEDGEGSTDGALSAPPEEGG